MIEDGLEFSLVFLLRSPIIARPGVNLVAVPKNDPDGCGLRAISNLYDFGIVFLLKRRVPSHDAAVHKLPKILSLCVSRCAVEAEVEREVDPRPQAVCRV